MSKMSELSQILDDLISCGEQLIQTANAIKECFTEPAESTEEPEQENKVPETEVRSYSKEGGQSASGCQSKGQQADSSRHR